jgi:excisionase family DNA binding protein
VTVEIVTAQEFAALVARIEALEAQLATNPWPEWMSVETASRYLDCSPERIRKLIASHRLPAHQEAPGCRVFLHRPELDHTMSHPGEPR